MPIRFERSDRIATITLDRPEKLNAIDAEMYQDLSRRLRQIDEDESIWVGVITGQGPKAFSTGADLVEHASESTSAAGWSVPRVINYDRGQEVQKPLVAAINGYCLGAGLELALACDIRIASDHARFGAPEVKWNLLHGYGAQRLPEVVGLSNALFILLTGDFVDAVEAHRIGLVQEVVGSDRVVARAHEIASRICENAPMAVRMTKELALRSRDMTLADGIRYYRVLSRLLNASDDLSEGMRAFAEKRKPRFKGQ